MDATFVVRSVDGDGLLEFGELNRVDGDDARYRVRLTGEGLIAETTVQDMWFAAWPEFFADLAVSWRGWAGTKAQESTEGDISIGATADSLGHVALHVRLRHLFGSPPGWIAESTIRLEAGQLDGLAQAAAFFFGSPGAVSRDLQQGTEDVFAIAEQETAPGEIAQQVWEELPPGARLRLLRKADLYWRLSGQEYERLRRVPYWAFYGPEDGAPLDWFNPRGYLLPKYRPGGGKFEEFRQWRRRARAAQWRAHLLQVRWKPIYDRVKVLEPFLYFAGFTTLQIWLRWDGRPNLPMIVAVISLLVGGGLALRLARRWFPWLGY